ncbi:hypothetical protein [Mycoplasma sp. Z473B]|uniref:hypothetical protein n=1 Tax=Mycoplasma sp. Z473B TaxID=3401667 RepID=UPI003AB001D6
MYPFLNTGDKTSCLSSFVWYSYGPTAYLTLSFFSLNKSDHGREKNSPLLNYAWFKGSL